MGEQTMVERVASAIQAKHAQNRMFPEHSAPWDRLNEAHRELFRDSARAAIAAMREPNEPMVLSCAKAAAEQHYEKNNAWDRCVEPEYRQNWLNSAKFGYCAAIDAALSKSQTHNSTSRE